MIQIKLGDILNSEETLKKLMDVPMKGKVAYKLARIAREVDKESQLFNDERNKLIEKYAERDEEGNFKPNENGQIYVDVTNLERVEQFTNEINELLETEIEVNAEKLSLNDLDETGMTPKDFNKMMVFIEE